MRKLIQCVLIFIILSLSNAFAVNDVYYFPYDSCFNINLEHEQDGTATGAYNQQYSDSDMVGLLGVANVSGKQVFSFEFTGSSDGDPWVYKSVSDPTLKIPFGLDMVVRYNDDKTAGVVHLGYNNNTNNLPEDIIELSRDEEGLVSGFTVTPGNDWNNMWIDIVIVIPLDKRNNFKYGSADDYQAQFNLKVVNSSNYPSVFVTMTGYYGNYNISNSGFLLFTVTPNANATVLDLSSSDIQEIGKFYYTTSAFRPDSNIDKSTTIDDGSDYDYDTRRESKIKMFVSASPTPTGNASFQLKHISAPEGTTSDRLTIGFQIGLLSENGSSQKPEDSIWYGTITGGNEPLNYLEGYGRYEKARNGDRDGLTLYDSGSIYFKLSPDEMKKTHTPGYYSANIYFHLITDE